MPQNKNKIIDLFLDKKLPFNCERYYPLTEKLLEKHKDILNWYSVSGNQNIKWSDDLINKYDRLLDWNTLIKNPALPWSVEFIKENLHKFEEKTELSNNTGLPWSEEFIVSLNDQKIWNPHWLTNNTFINWTQRMLERFKMIDHNLSHVNGKELWTKEFIFKHKDNLCWNWLCYNPNLPWSEELIEKLMPSFKAWESRHRNIGTFSPMSALASNTGFPWTNEFIRKYYFDLDREWTDLSKNEKLPWNEGLLEEFEEKWNWPNIGSNNGINFTEELINKYPNKLFWHDLSSNTGIIWTEKLIDKYYNYCNKTKLFNNPSLPWSIDFILKHENKCIEGWSIPIKNKISDVLWDKVFKDLMDENIIDEILTRLKNPERLKKQVLEKLDKEYDVTDTIGINYRKLIEQVFAIEYKESGINRYKEEIESAINKIKKHILEISVCNKNYWGTSLKYYMDMNNKRLNKELYKAIQPIRLAILNFYKKVNLDIGDIGSAISQLDEQRKYARRIEKKGGNVTLVNEHIYNFLKDAGYRASNLAYVLWEFEKLRKKSFNKTDKNSRRKQLSLAEENKLVILNCTFKSKEDYGIRVWETICLCDKDSEHKSKLIHAENIAMYPFKRKLPESKVVKFKLYFDELPTNCKTFYLIENRSEDASLEVKNIQRNDKDEYDINWKYNEKSIEKIYYQQELKKYL